MKLKAKFTFLLAFIMLPFTARLQEPWTLEKCIQYAIDNNLQVKQYELDVKSNEASLLGAKFDVAPNLSANANHAYNYGRVTNYNTNAKEKSNLMSTSFSFSSNMPLFNGFQVINTVKKKQFDLKASVMDVEAIKNNITLTVVADYLQILFQQELVENALRQLKQSQLQVERTKLLVDAGSLPEGNLYEVEALEASDELTLVDAQNLLAMYTLNLTQLLEIKSPEGFSIVKPEISDSLKLDIPGEPQNIYGFAVESKPQILAAQYRVSSSELDLKIAKGEYFPQLTLFGSYGTGVQKYLKSSDVYTSTDPFFTQIKNNAEMSFGLSLSIPIFNRWSAHTAVTQAKISLENAKLSLETQKNNLYKDIQQAYVDALAAQKKQSASIKSQQSARESFRYTENKFNLGLLTALDYTTSRNNLAKADTDLLQAKYEFVFKVKILDFYLGNPIKL
ncbi:MAG: TolC family protein [Bacteroidales bacterium]|nr:TolC family protein [Bacteroidales bacterium]HPD94453.1 TolC family protein [Tenuifilaceae bacterium]HRX30836.1 TolC family protein [Tenuifilaceae bacterium]